MAKKVFIRKKAQKFQRISEASSFSVVSVQIFSWNFIHCNVFFCFVYLFLFCLEINRTRNELFHGMANGVETTSGDLVLPPPTGPRVKLSEKVFAPVKEFPKVCILILTKDSNCNVSIYINQNLKKERFSLMWIFSIMTHISIENQDWIDKEVWQKGEHYFLKGLQILIFLQYPFQILYVVLVFIVLMSGCPPPFLKMMLPFPEYNHWSVSVKVQVWCILVNIFFTERTLKPMSDFIPWSMSIMFINKPSN